MKQETFRFLEPQDWQHMLSGSKNVTYKAGQRIVEEGQRDPRLLIVNAGFVRIERNTTNGPVSYARIGRDEVLGEMSFLESRNATASAVADTDVELTVVEESHIESLMASDLGFASRFFRSLAVGVSARLRETAGALAAARSVRRSRMVAGEVPKDVLTGLEKLKGQLTAVELTVLTGETVDATKRVIEALDGMQALLHTHSDDPGAVAAIDRTCYGYLQSSRTFASCTTAGTLDAQTLDLIEAEDPNGSAPIGRFVDAWFLARPMCRSIQARSQVLGSKLGGGAHRVTLLGGSGRELGQKISKDVALTVLDRDPSWAANLGQPGNVHGFEAQVSDLIPGSRQFALEPQDLIYATADFVSDSTAKSFLGWAFERLREGGELVLTALEWTPADRVFADHLLKWTTHARTAEELTMLAQGIFDTKKVNVETRDGNLILSCKR